MGLDGGHPRRPVMMRLPVMALTRHRGRSCNFHDSPLHENGWVHEEGAAGTSIEGEEEEG